MPIFEYCCQDCGKVSSFLLLSRNEPFTPVCPSCGSLALARILSRINVRLSEETRLDRLADPAAWAGVDENDPRSVARMLKKLGQEMGEDFPGEVDQLVEETMAGQETAEGKGEESD